MPSFHYYQVSGLRIRSDLPLPELIEASDGPIDVEIRVERSWVEPPVVWRPHIVEPDGSAWIHSHRDEQGYSVDTGGYARFHLRPDGREILAYARPRLASTTLRHLIVDQALPLALTLQARIVLHGSCVEVNGKSIVLLGRSGWGKSTLATSLCLEGARLLADDCVVLEFRDGNYWAWPSYPGVRLWPETAQHFHGEDTHHLSRVAHYHGKCRLTPTRRASFSPTASAVATIVVLAAPRASTRHAGLTAPPPSAALMSLVQHSFRLDLDGNEALSREFRHLADVARRVPIHRFQYPRTMAALPSVIARLQGLVQTHPA